MLTLHGAGVSNGIAIGMAFVLHRESPEIPEYVLAEDQVEAEIDRFHQAVRLATLRLAGLKAEVPEEAPTEISSFIDAHLLMLQDPLIASAPVATIRTEQRNAEWALQEHSTRLTAIFDQMEDPYLRSKKIDVEQVVSRVQSELLNVNDEDPMSILDGLTGQVVVSNDLSPADTVLFKRHKMAAFVTNLGGPISHTAILARSLRIPAVVGLHGATRYIRNGEMLVVDGHRGVIIVSPDDRILRHYRKEQKRQQRRAQALQKLRSEDAITRDRRDICLLANIELPEDIRLVDEVAAGGVGLYRTEYLFMNRQSPPGEEEQFAAYSHIVKTLRSPVAIRTLDLGADKQVDGGRTGTGHSVINPALGLRAVRLCLRDPGLFRPQLRAILRASAHGPVEIMVPMISSLEELDQITEIIEDTKRELQAEKLPFNPDVPVGGMIEVPAAAISADLFARKLDFLSIGTNDLIQYTLAIDRVDDEVNYLYDPLHPSVLRLIKNTIDAGRRADIPVSMCGEMAADVTYTRLLLGLGLKVFSMDPVSVLEVKQRIIDTDISAIEALCEEILVTTESSRFRDLIEQINAA